MKASKRGEVHSSLAGQILSLKRYQRIGLVMVYSIGLTLLLMPMVDNVYLSYFFSAQTVLVPALLSAGAGVIMYAVGWRLMIGYVGELPPERASVVIYVLMGTVILLMVITLVVIGSVVGIEQ
ncbi:MAG: hypothetical protein L6Q98_08265 [Anaerolineae bacterium]|nr:hypothetical protein [Anaerolineae bacterium]NUQ02584.1 hypothetical protein [Anaerolineae bacterium]